MGSSNSRESENGKPAGRNKPKTASDKLDSTRKYLQIEEIIQCSICEEKFEDPRMLKCQHSFCFQCLKDEVKVQQEKNAASIQCPKCNETVTSIETLLALPENKWGSYFPKNITIAKILENLPDFDEFCDLHEDKIYEYFCEAERKLVCSTCILNQHKHCKSVSPVTDFTNDRPKFENACKTLHADLKKGLGQTHTMINQLKNNIRKLEKDKETIRTELKDFRDTIMAEITKNEEAINSEVDDMLENKVKELEMVEELQSKFREYSEQISKHRKLEPMAKLRTLQIIDTFTAEDILLMQNAQKKIKTMHIEFVLDVHKVFTIKKQLANCVDHFLVAGRPIY